MREKILELKRKHPTWGYGKIAAKLSCSKSTVCYYLSTTCKPKKVANRRALRIRYKTQLINEHGGRCSKCGYNRSLAALSFHHTDPSKKLADVTRLSSAALMYIEADKCVLLCANCHMELTHPSYGGSD